MSGFCLVAKCQCLLWLPQQVIGSIYSPVHVSIYHLDIPGIQCLTGVYMVQGGPVPVASSVKTPSLGVMTPVTPMYRSI